MSQVFSNTKIQNPLDAEAIQAWLISRVSEQLNVEASELDIREPLDSYGLNSAQAMSLIGEGEKLLGFQISPMLLWHYPTIESLSQRLAEEADESDSEIFEI